jgi:hypothetical protein
VTSSCGAIQQLQTSVNTADQDLPMFLTVRAWQVRARSIWLVLVPHDSYNPKYFAISRAETVAYIVFPTNTQIACFENFAFETKTFSNVTSNPIYFSFVQNYVAPGVFGMLGSVNSMVDSTSLSVYDVSSTEAIFITKEDQCTTEQTIHITPEVVHALVVGRTSDPSLGWFQCNAAYFDAPTISPTLSPTIACQTVEVTRGLD